MEVGGSATRGGRFKVQGTGFEVGGWRLEVGGSATRGERFKVYGTGFEVRGWRLEGGGWRLEVGGSLGKRSLMCVRDDRTAGWRMEDGEMVH